MTCLGYIVSCPDCIIVHPKEFPYLEKIYSIILSHKGLRVDGRRPPELRRLQCQLGVFQQADGSALLEQGNTKVLATVYGPHDVREILLRAKFEWKASYERGSKRIHQFLHR